MSTTSPLRIHAGMPAIVFHVPAGTDLLTVPRPAPPLANPTGAIAQALLAPRGTRSLAQVVATASPQKAPADKTAVIVVSDITRPDVPYTGSASILHPVLHTLEAQGLFPEHMTILIATGTHRASTQAEKITMFGADVAHRYPIVDHSATDTLALRWVARTAQGTDVYINTCYLDSGFTNSRSLWFL
jgi:lactate racemase